MNDGINNDGGLIWTELKDLTLPLPEEVKYTPEAIQETIEQIKQREDIRISEIKDEPGAITITGQIQIRVNKGWDDHNTLTGVIAHLPKA